MILRTAVSREIAAPPERVVAYDMDTGVATTEDGSTWQVTEGALVGPFGEELERLPGHNAFWFALVNHAPRFRLYEEEAPQSSLIASGCNLFAYLEGTSIAATTCTL